MGTTTHQMYIWSWKLTGEVNSTAPYIDALWLLAGKLMKLTELDTASQKLDDLFKFRALICHQGPLKPTDPNWKGCKYNVFVDWETGEKTYEPLSFLAADDPVTCAMYAK